MKLLLSLLLFLFLFTTVAEARVLPQARGSKPSSTKAAGSGVGISPRLRSDRQALLVNFSNLQNATEVSYLLRYKSNGQDEGAMGALNLSGASSDTAELLFGTCSKNVCRYHTNITEVRFEVSYSSKSGKKYLRKFRVRI